MMTQHPENPFYENDVLAEEFDYTVVSDPEPMTPSAQNVVSMVARTAAALATGGILVFGPFAMSTMPQAVNPAALEKVIIQVLPTGVGEVPIPAAHAQAAQRFRKMFRAVPLADVERVKEPDYGL